MNARKGLGRPNGLRVPPQAVSSPRHALEESPPQALPSPCGGQCFLGLTHVPRQDRAGGQAGSAGCGIPWEASMAPAVSWKSRSCCRKRMAWWVGHSPGGRSGARPFCPVRRRLEASRFTLWALAAQ